MAREYIKVSSSARNIGVTFDSHINLEKYVVIKTAKQTSSTYRILQKYGTVSLKTKLRYLFMLLFLPRFFDLIGPKYKALTAIEGFCVAREYIKVSSSARNIGVTFDSHINLEKYVVIKTAKQTSSTYRILQKYGTVYLIKKLRYLFMLLFLLSCFFATHCCMGYNDRFSIDYSMFKTVLLAWC